MDRRGIEPRLPGCKPGVFPLDQRPASRGLFGSRTRSASVPRRRAAKTPTDHPRIPDGVEPSLWWLSPRRLCRWTKGSQVTEVGVEPTKSRGSRPRRFANLRTRSCQARGLTREVALDRSAFTPPAVNSQASSLRTSSCRPRYRTGHTGLMGASWAPAAPAMFQ